MKITWLHTGADGRSHFKDVLVPLKEERESMRSALFPGAGSAFADSQGGGPGALHNAPRRQWVVVLAGHMDVDLGDGNYRRFAPGEVFLADDTAGEGHLIRRSDTPRSILTVPVDASVDVTGWTPA